MAAADTTSTAIDPVADIRLLRLLQLVSPTLPVGAFAFSQGMEWAVEAGWVSDAHQAADWIGGLLTHTMAAFDVPILARLHAAWQAQDVRAFDFWNRRLQAGRGSAELQQEDRHMGQAMLRLLLQLQPDRLKASPCHDPSFTAMFALAACNWRISAAVTCSGYLWSWVENQVAAAIKLVPLGQTDGQKILMQLAEQIPAAVSTGLALADDAIGAAAPGMAMASALHETQHTRLFRS